MFALVDCNNFYASCERVFNPALNEKPVVVLSNNDGCVISRSNEAKALGIPMGAPAFKYEDVFKREDVKVFSANFPLYGDMSRRVMDILSDFTPEMEIYSIDESFLRFDGFENYDLREYAIKIRQKVLKWTGIPVSIGVAKTKSLSKAAAHIAKKFPDKTEGVYVIDTDEKIIKALKWLKVGDVWGIGRRYEKKLNEKRVRTAFEFTQLSDQYIKQQMSVVSLYLKRDLLGEPILRLEEPQNKKNIATTRSFDKNYTKFEDLSERISTFAVLCAEKLRKQNSCCNSLVVFIRTNKHKNNLKQYSGSIKVKLPFATNSNIEIAKFANSALKQIFKEGYEYKKAGVIVQDFSDANVVQQNLFENSDQRHVALMNSIDYINRNFGQQKVRLATQDQGKVWKMKQENLSPKYTTNLDDIITIKV